MSSTHSRTDLQPDPRETEFACHETTIGQEGDVKNHKGMSSDETMGKDNLGYENDPDQSENTFRKNGSHGDRWHNTVKQDGTHNKDIAPEKSHKKSSAEGKPDVVKCVKHAQTVKESTSGNSDSEDKQSNESANDVDILVKTNENDVIHDVTRNGRRGSSISIGIAPMSEMTEIPLDSPTDVSDWRISLDDFTSKRKGSKRKQKDVSKRARSYYKTQDDLIDAFKDIRFEIDDGLEGVENVDALRRKASLFAKLTLLCNVILLIIKIIAVVFSGSISLISSLVDSCVDLLSGMVIWATTRAIKKTDPYLYPQGRTKLEPLAIIILAVIMAVASLQLVKEAITKIIGLADGSQSPPLMDFATLGIASATVVTKLVLFLVCRRVAHPTIQALAQDHRNDVLSNGVAIIFGYIGSQQMQVEVNVPGLVYLDPIGAILISLYIAVNWVFTAKEQIKRLTGHTAPPEFISKITWLSMDHHSQIQVVDTVRAFHFGHNYLVEVDIVLPQDMSVREAHDIGELLQQKLERLPEVERAFVHIDYETTHKPTDEHKVV